MKHAALSCRLVTLLRLATLLSGLALVCLVASSARAATPTITSFDPTSGEAGTKVRIHGSDFLVANSVTFGGDAYAVGSAVSNEEIEVIVPNYAQTGPITVITLDGNVSSTTPFVIGSDTPPIVVGPVITSATQASGTMDSPFTYQIKADRNVSSYGATSLPSGLSLDAASGIISGTPEEAGYFLVDISATDATGTGNATLDLDITSDSPVMTVSTTRSRIVAAEGQTSKFRFTLSHAVPRDTMIQYFTSGSANDHLVYNLSGSQIIPAGKTSTTLKLSPVFPPGQNLPAGSVLKVKLRIDSYSDGAYTVGTPGAAVVKIVEP